MLDWSELRLCETAICPEYHTIRSAAISPVRVVVVDVTIGVHIPRIVRVAPISRAQADVLRFSPHPYNKHYLRCLAA